MKKIIPVLLLFISGFITAQSTEELKQSAIRDAKAAANASLKLDYETILKYTHPSIVEVSGGKDYLIKAMSDMFDNMKKQGFVFEKAEVIEVTNVLEEDGEYHCLVRNNNQMVISGMRIKSKSHLFGFYDAEKKQWYFLEAEKLKNKDLVNQLLPDFKTTINIPNDEVTTEEIK